MPGLFPANIGIGVKSADDALWGIAGNGSLRVEVENPEWYHQYNFSLRKG